MSMHAGHTNVHYVGDRVKKPSQLNGKSANLNHVLLTKIYPFVTTPGTSLLPLPPPCVYSTPMCVHTICGRSGQACAVLAPVYARTYVGPAISTDAHGRMTVRVWGGGHGQVLIAPGCTRGQTPYATALSERMRIYRHGTY